MVVGHFKFRLALAEGAWPSGVFPFVDKCSWWRVTRAITPGTTVWRLEVPHSSVGSNHHASVNLHPRKMAKSEVSLQCGCGYSAIFPLAENFHPTSVRILRIPAPAVWHTFLGRLPGAVLVC